MSNAVTQITTSSILADFSLDLYRQMGNETASVCASPISITLALAMLYFGAGGKTREQLQQALFRSSLAEDDVPAYLSGLWQPFDYNPCCIATASRMYIDVSYRVLPTYRNTLRIQLRSDMRSIDFDNPIDAAVDVNRWVKKATHGKIQKLVSSDLLNRATSLIMLNVVYFNGRWTNPFSPKYTKLETFYSTPEKHFKVEMMNKLNEFHYHETDDCQVLNMGYTPSRISMFVILPKARYGLDEFTRYLTAERLLQLMTGGYSRRVQVKLPKFSFDFNFDLRKTLKAMGISDLFKPTANLSAISRRKPLFLSSALHRVMIKVDERGTEIVGMTYGFSFGAAPREMEPVKFFADHPFLFVLSERDGKNILFLGRYGG